MSGAESLKLPDIVQKKMGFHSSMMDNYKTMDNPTPGQISAMEIGE